MPPMDNKQASLALVIILSLCSYSAIKYCECKALIAALEQSGAGYDEFMKKSVKGKRLYEYVNPNTVGTFRVGDASIACAQLKTPLPVLHRKE